MQDETRYVAKPLEADQIDLVYPLVREIIESLSVEAWRRYAGQFVLPDDVIPQDRGIVVIEAKRAYLRGMFAYRVVPCLDTGRRFMVDCIVAPEAIDRRSVARHLIETMHHYAGRHRCETIDTKLAQGNLWVADMLRRTGYHEEHRSIFRHSCSASPGVSA